MSDIDNVGPIIFRYQTLYSSLEYTGLTLNSEGYIEENHVNASGDSIPDKNEEIKFTIKWGNKEEHIVLKAQQ